MDYKISAFGKIIQSTTSSRHYVNTWPVRVPKLSFSCIYKYLCNSYIWDTGIRRINRNYNPTAWYSSQQNIYNIERTTESYTRSTTMVVHIHTADWCLEYRMLHSIQFVPKYWNYSHEFCVGLIKSRASTNVYHFERTIYADPFYIKHD